MLANKRDDLIHWNYFIALENDIDNISHYIELSRYNKNTYSIELAKLLMTASSEIDVILKMICNIYGEKTENINEYKNCVKKYCKNMINEKYFINKYLMSGKPWFCWSKKDDKNPIWWKAYNSVKHSRNISFRDAKLENVLNAVGALLICNIYYYSLKFSLTMVEAIDKLKPESKIFTLNSNYYYEPVRYRSSKNT